MFLKLTPRPNGKGLGSLGHAFQKDYFSDKDNPITREVAKNFSGQSSEVASHFK